MDFLDRYLGEVLVGVFITLIGGIIATIRTFFAGIRKMNERLNDLEAKLETNVKSDDEIKKWVIDLVKHKAGI